MLLIAGSIVSIAYKSFYDEFFLSQACWEKVQTEDEEYSGLVKSKFIDYDNHGLNAITIIEHGQVYLLHFPYDEQSEIWEKVKVGDSITKNKNSLNYYLKSGVKKDTILVVYDCSK